MYRFVFIYWVCILTLLLFLLPSCDCGPRCEFEKSLASGPEASGGGQDLVTIDLPFEEHYATLCTQGAHGDYSHNLRTTEWDVDLDTPNDRDDLVFAPVSGTAYVHDTSRTRNFGVHINIDMGDGTFIVLGHLDDALIDNGSEVAAGQLIAIEGTTGISVGDHVHIGRHEGDASKDAIYGASVEGLAFTMRDHDDGNASVVEATEEMTCGIPNGHDYLSDLETPLWHPNGTLVQIPGQSTVFLLEDGAARPFLTEDAFTAGGYDVADVTLISATEFTCYSAGTPVESMAQVTDGLRDGTLVKRDSASDVYVMSDGIARPIASWEDYLLLGWEDRAITVLTDAEFAANVDLVGSCASDSYCISRIDVLTCGGQEDDVFIDLDTGDLPRGDSFILRWATPDGQSAERIALSGEYTRADGSTDGWQTFATQGTSSYLQYEWLDSQIGDSLRFSVEFTQHGQTSWSCLAPYPPGTVQGTIAASFAGESVPITVADDPSSDGCGLQVTLQ